MITQRFVALMVLALSMTPVASAQTLYSNAGIVTNPGAGSFGADVSQASATVNSGGAASYLSGAGPGFRLADEFTVPAGQSWTVSGVTNFLYISSTTVAYGNPPASPFTSINLNIWNGNPSQGTSSIVASSSTFGAVAWSNIYRTFNTILVNPDRPVFSVQAAFPGVVLAAGTYYMDVQATGVSPNGVTTVFSPFAMTAPGGVPNTVSGNAMQMSSAGIWSTIAVGSPTQGVEVPFSIQGIVSVPEPATMALLGLTAVCGVSGWMRWRKNQKDAANQELRLPSQ